MKLLLPLLLALTAGLVVWALLPSAPPRAPIAPPTVQGATPSAEPNGADPSAADPNTAGAPGAPAVVATAPATPEPAGRPRLSAPDLRAPARALPVGEYRPVEPGRHGRRPDMPMPEATPAAVKETLRRYYGNLPRSGRMPARITVEELLSPALVAALGVPPDSQVVELGHHPATGPEGFEEALALADDQHGMFGITVVTPDGQRIRDYVRLVPAQ
ncbi:MAG: hypothetical protein R3F65_09060 [bacterium]|nr:hypothetical protein [Myxococcales bacterium]